MDLIFSEREVVYYEKTIDLLNEVVEMGYNREKALEDIDVCLDQIIGYENRESLESETISDDVYDDIYNGFLDELEYRSDLRKLGF